VIGSRFLPEHANPDAEKIGPAGVSSTRPCLTAPAAWEHFIRKAWTCEISVPDTRRLTVHAAHVAPGPTCAAACCWRALIPRLRVPAAASPPGTTDSDDSPTMATEQASERHGRRHGAVRLDSVPINLNIQPDPLVQLNRSDLLRPKS
jgi:hypothetical protein